MGACIYLNKRTENDIWKNYMSCLLEKCLLVETLFYKQEFALFLKRIQLSM